jgi:oligopeptide transport system substrate-binding protein
VRRALTLSVDRRAIVEGITRAGERPSWSFTPPGIEGYPPVELPHAAGGEYEENLARDIREARRLLAEAGFGPDAARFPSFEILFNTDQTNEDLAEVVASGWQQELGLGVKLLNQEWKVYLDSQRNLDYDVSRSSWIGDYADPNTFLDVFVTGGENSRTGWGNARYDELVEKAAREPDEERRFALLAEAEAILLDELPILPLYDYVTRNLVNPRLGGFHENLRDEHFCKFWYWMDDEELAAKRAARGDDRERAPAPGPAEGLYPPSHPKERGRR